LSTHPDRSTLERVRALLRAAGASDADIAQAEANDVLDLLVADRLVLPAGPRYTEAEVAERAQMDLELLRRLWRALGFPDVGPDEAVFTDLDVEALFTLRAIKDLGVADMETSVQLARVIGSSMARIAEAEMALPFRARDPGDEPTSPSASGPGDPGAGGSGAGDSVEAAARFAALADSAIPAMVRLLEFVWRRHVQAAIRRTMLLRARGDGALPVLGVGFADMVGFTTLSQQLSEESLAAVVARFEEVARDTVTAGGGRVVKMIGDEAMFVADSAIDAARIGLALAEAYADDELLSDVRVALAVGPVLVQDGDFYGPVVNLASRVVNMAAPGSVLVTDDFHAAVSERAEEFAFLPLRPRPVKDLGRVQLWVLFRPGSEPVEPDRRMGRRFDRLIDLLHDLDDLREKGEKLIAKSRAAAAAATDDASHGEANGGDPVRS
jgi:adenylate cyclase